METSLVVVYMEIKFNPIAGVWIYNILTVLFNFFERY